MHKYGKWLLIISAAILSIVISIIFFGSITAEDIINHSPSSMTLTVLVFIALYAIKSIIMFIPLPVLFISAGVLFPKGWAIVISSACLTMELTIDWLIGKKMGQTKVVDFVHSKPKMASLIDLYKERAVFTCFLLPSNPHSKRTIQYLFRCGQDVLPYISWHLVCLD